MHCFTTFTHQTKIFRWNFSDMMMFGMETEMAGWWGQARSWHIRLHCSGRHATMITISNMVTWDIVETIVISWYTMWWQYVTLHTLSLVTLTFIQVSLTFLHDNIKIQRWVHCNILTVFFSLIWWSLMSSDSVNERVTCHSGHWLCTAITLTGFPGTYPYHRPCQHSV